MRKFDPGEAVTCVDNSAYSDRLTEGRTYIVHRQLDEFVDVTDDFGKPVALFSYRFVSAKPACKHPDYLEKFKEFARSTNVSIGSLDRMGREVFGVSVSIGILFTPVTDQSD